MSTHRTISNLWDAFQNAVDLADADGRKLNNANGHAECNALRDYTRAHNWRMSSLLGRETANERKHRLGKNSLKDFTVGDAAKLQIMQWAEYAMGSNSLPSAHLFLTMRPTAVEAEVIGFLCRRHLNVTWRERLAELDYARLMQASA